MNLYLIEQDVCGGYDTYDSAVVAAETEEKAKATHPAYKDGYWDTPNADGSTQLTKFYASKIKDGSFRSHEVWAPPEFVTVEFLGVAKGGTEPGVICASFNAG